MRILAFLLIAALPTFLPGQVPKTDSWHTVQRMCGRLSQRKHDPRKPDTDYQRDKVKALRSTHLELYVRQGTVPCCAGLVLAGKTFTDDDGAFSFKNISPGLYWIEFELSGHRYSYPLRYEPAKHADPDCELFNLELNESHEPPLDRILVIE